MKRDIELLRNIMLYLEENLMPGKSIQSTNLSSFYEESNDDSYRIFSDHIAMLLESGLIEAKPLHAGGFTIYLISRITSIGHDFLDALRADSVWAVVKQKTKQAGGATIAIMIEVAKDCIKKAILE